MLTIEKDKGAPKDDALGKPLSAEEQKGLRDGAPPAGYENQPPVLPAPEAKPGEAAAAPELKPGEAAPGEAKPAAEPVAEDAFSKLERELAKPEGQEDLKDFSERERGYFFQMRRDRKNRQQAEADRDAALRDKILAEKKLKEAKPEPAAVEEDPLAELRKKDPTDFMTVSEVLGAVEKILKAKPASKPEAEVPRISPMQVRYLEMSEREARAAHEDFDAVIELAEELVNNEPEQLKAVAVRVKAGENPAEVMYDVIKQHPEFAKLLPAAKVRAEAKTKARATAKTPGSNAIAPSNTPAKAPEELKKAQDAQAALAANAGRTKTTGHISSTDGKPAGELTADEFENMSEREFRKLPKDVREAALRKYGAAPARSPNE